MAYRETIQHKPGLLREAGIQIGSGGFAGFVEACIMHPMDLIKTRFQLQFFSFEQYKKLFSNYSSKMMVFYFAGFLTGVTEGILVNPFEVVKVQMQSDRKHIKHSASTFAVTKRILVQQGFGLNGLNKGLSATVMRNGVFNTFYFGIYNSLLPQVHKHKEYAPELFLKFIIGFTAGTVASCMNIPFDVAKSRIQGPQNEIQYKGTVRTICTVYRREGFRALYKGLLPKILRLGPGGAIMLIVYEHMKAYLNAKVPI
ncbi:Mitochondrial 2-oxodicarboxylate carrier [Dufourea novaeangliae]|uniref:Mitochondrial 2-oxodicarboxylate carrier n=1 Tax=Dufourea novaeangliae TaxID=178035 RepID=A0A154NXR9_DUFNO|nr:Mitochondrial 2-oxodicarboxylate carrier [Dufourea novaeangliae]